MSESKKIAFETNMGNFEVTLYEDTPIATKNLVDKAGKSFFDGIVFHRVVKGFVIQGGDPTGTGSGGGKMNVDPIGKHSNKKGTISMASGSRSKPIADQSDCQFFVNLADNTPLDGYGFVAFGEVTSGMDVVEKIGKVDTEMTDWGEKSKPVNQVIIQKSYVL